MFLTIYIFTGNSHIWTNIKSKKTFKFIVVLFFLWLIVDQVAIYLELWNFPAGTAFPFQIFKLPIEEYILFILYSIFCLMLIEIFNKND